MPKRIKNIEVIDLPIENILPNTLKSIEELNWEIVFASNNSIIAHTTNGAIKGTQVSVHITNNTIQIISEQINDELLDINKRNEKNINLFIEKFTANKTVDSNTILEYQEKLLPIQTAIQDAILHQNKEVEEINKVMNLTNSPLYVTYTIIAINIIIFILMAINGAGVFDTNAYVHLKWGSNFAPLTLSGDWWRLITSTFIHFGIIHIAMNMYCLYQVGIYLEPMLGKAKYITAYLCTGVIASIVSLWWHTSPTNSAGASGAVFGMYGLFLALLTSNIIPKQVRDALLKSIGIFIFFNLAYGMKSGVDNAAHVGGLVSGFIIGYIFIFVRKKETEQVKLHWITPLIAITTFIGTFIYLQKNKQPIDERIGIINDINSHLGSFKGTTKYDELMQDFGKLEENAIKELSDTTITNEVLKTTLVTKVIPLWIKCKEVLSKTITLDVNPALKERSKNLNTYLDLRIKEDSVLLEYIEGKNMDNSLQKLTTVRESITKIVEVINPK